MTSDAVVDDKKMIEAQSAVGDWRNKGCFLSSVIKEGSMEEWHLIRGLEEWVAVRMANMGKLNSTQWSKQFQSIVAGVRQVHLLKSLKYISPQNIML